MATSEIDALKVSGAFGPATDGSAVARIYADLLASLEYDSLSSDPVVAKRSNVAVRVVRQLLNKSRSPRLLHVVECGEDEDAVYPHGHGNYVLAHDETYSVDVNLVGSVVGTIVSKIRDAPRAAPRTSADADETNSVIHWRVVVESLRDAPDAPDPKSRAEPASASKPELRRSKRLKRRDRDEFHVIVNKTRWFATDFVLSRGRLRFSPAGNLVPYGAKVILLGESCGSGILDVLRDCVIYVGEQTFDELSAAEDVERKSFKNYAAGASTVRAETLAAESTDMSARSSS